MTGRPAASRAFIFMALVVVLAGCEEPRYLPARELDTRPFPLAHVDPAYPASPGEAQIYGKVRLDLYISARGAVDRIEVLESGVPKEFLDAAIKAFAESRWEPGVKAGRKVRSLKSVVVSFEPPRGAIAPMQPGS